MPEFSPPVRNSPRGKREVPHFGSVPRSHPSIYKHFQIRPQAAGHCGHASGRLSPDRVAKHDFQALRLRTRAPKGHNSIPNARNRSVSPAPSRRFTAADRILRTAQPRKSGCNGSDEYRSTACTPPPPETIARTHKRRNASPSEDRHIPYPRTDAPAPVGRPALTHPASESLHGYFGKIFSQNCPNLFAANDFLLIFAPAIKN